MRSTCHAEPVVADQVMAVGDPVPESAKIGALPVEFEVTHPPCRSDERWSVPAYLVGHAAIASGRNRIADVPTIVASLPARSRPQSDGGWGGLCFATNAIGRQHHGGDRMASAKQADPKTGTGRKTSKPRAPAARDRLSHASQAMPV